MTATAKELAERLNEISQATSRTIAPTLEQAAALILSQAERISALETVNRIVRPRGDHFVIDHDGFAGTVIGDYVTKEGKAGVVLQQDGTRVVHVYGEKWLSCVPDRRAKQAMDADQPVIVAGMKKGE